MTLDFSSKVQNLALIFGIDLAQPHIYFVEHAESAMYIVHCTYMASQKQMFNLSSVIYTLDSTAPPNPSSTLVPHSFIQGVFFDWSPQKSLSIEILYENT